MARTSRYVEVEDRFDEMEEAIEDGLDAYIEEVYEETVNQIVSNMAAGKDAMGRRWEPTKAPGDTTPLVDSGRMMTSIPRASRVVESANAAVFSVGTDYGEIHEFGAPDAGIPARPFLLPGLEYALTITPSVFRDTVDTRVQRVLL